MRAHFGGVDAEVLLLDVIEHRLPRGGRHRVAAKRGDGRAFHRVRHLRLGDRQSNGKSVAQSLGAGDDVGRDAVLLDAEPLAARAAPGGLHLVADENAAVLADDTGHDLKVFPRRRDEAADALDRLGDEAGDAAGSRGADQVLHILRALHIAIRIGEPERTAVAVGVVRVARRPAAARRRDASLHWPVSVMASAERP